jgi:hypothetical protein
MSQGEHPFETRTMRVYVLLYALLAVAALALIWISFAQGWP